MYFILKTTSIYQAVKIGKRLFFKYSKFFKTFFFILSLFFFSFFVYLSLSESGTKFILKKTLGGAILSFSFLLFVWHLDKFFESRLKNPALNYSLSQAVERTKEFNLASFLDYEAASVCFEAEKLAKKQKIKEGIPSEILLYQLLNPKNKEINFIFGRGGINLKEIREELKEKIKEKRNRWSDNQEFEKIILKSLETAFSRRKQRIGVGDILISFAKENDFFKGVLMLNDLNAQDIENLANWFEKSKKRIEKLKRFWEYENLIKKGSLGRDWASGYTIHLDKYSKDWREIIKRTGFREIVGHKKEINQIERILAKEELNNVLLVGEPGTGRKSIIEALSQRIFLGKSVPSLNYKRLLEVDLLALISEVKPPENPAAVLDMCFAEALMAGNVILVIDEFQNFVQETPREGEFDIAPVLTRYLNLPNFRIIAITTYEGLHRTIEKRPNLLQLFTKVETREISPQETLELLENLVPYFEHKYRAFIAYKSLKEIITLSSKYIASSPFPKKAIEVLDEAMAYVSSKKESILTTSHIKKVVSERTEIPLEDLEVKEKEILLNLEDLIHQRIIDQEEAVREISSALRRARAEIHTRKGPIGSFLFLGPTGVGKTETAKALSSIYFKGEENMIRLDMSEFQNLSDIEKLIGSEKIKGLLTTPVREKPFSLLLLDEIEKAHPNILNLFLQVLDEGWITDGLGRKVSFRETIIIATSNAGAEIIREDIKKDKNMDMVKEDLLDFILKRNIFRPEFINRFDSIVIFKPLDKKSLILIARLMLKKLKEKLLDKGIIFEITPELCEKIVNLSYNPAFGAREMRRVIQDKIENMFATLLLSGELKRGSRVKVNPENFNPIITSRA